MERTPPVRAGVDWIESMGGAVDLAPLAVPAEERRRKLNAYATAVCAHVDMGGRHHMEGWLWEQRLQRTARAALILLHQAQGNGAGIAPEAFAAARRELWGDYDEMQAWIAEQREVVAR